MEKIEKSIEELENKINPPERDLMTGDVFRMMCKIIFGFAVMWIVTVGGFVGYIIYKDYQYSNSINQMMDKYNEFINSFEFMGGEYTYAQDGNGNNIIGDNNTAYGAETKNKDSQSEEEIREGEIYP